MGRNVFVTVYRPRRCCVVGQETAYFATRVGDVER
jgi:hypothetical protein